MHKTLADRLVKRPLKGDAVAAEAAQLLRRPATNHSDRYTPMVERFVFAVEDQNVIYQPAEGTGFALLRAALRPPLSVFWMEIGDVGFFVQNETVTTFHHVQSRKTVMSGVTCDFVRDLRNGVGREIRFDFTSPAHASSAEPILREAEHLAADSLAMFCAMCSMINSPRSATRERVLVNGTDPAKKATYRRLQRGYPVFSFNRVKLKRPDTSKLSSDVLTTNAQTSKRGHWVIGHWRLIDNNPEPYWTWVEAHPRGDEAEGFIHKERFVNLSGDLSHELRRGFVIPSMPGVSGSRIPAVRG